MSLCFKHKKVNTKNILQHLQTMCAILETLSNIKTIRVSHGSIRSPLIFTHIEDIVICYTNFAVVLSYLGYMRLQKLGEGPLLTPSPPPHNNLINYCTNIHHIMHIYFTMCFTNVPARFSFKCAIVIILQ